MIKAAVEAQLNAALAACPAPSAVKFWGTLLVDKDTFDTAETLGAITARFVQGNSSITVNATGMSVDQRAAVAEVFAEAEVPHAWVGDEVVVPAELEEVADTLLDRLEQESLAAEGDGDEEEEGGGSGSKASGALEEL